MHHTTEMILEEIESEAWHILEGATAGVPYSKRVDQVLRAIEDGPLTKEDVEKLRTMINCMRVQEVRAHVMAALQFMKAFDEELLHSNLKIEKEILQDGIVGMERFHLKQAGTGSTLEECFKNSLPLDVRLSNLESLSAEPPKAKPVDGASSDAEPIDGAPLDVESFDGALPNTEPFNAASSHVPPPGAKPLNAKPSRAKLPDEKSLNVAPKEAYSNSAQQ